MADDVEDSATAAYRRTAREIGALFRIIRERVMAHARRARRSMENWGHVGDLTSAREGLVDVASLFAGESSEKVVRAEIERRIRELLGG